MLHLVNTAAASLFRKTLLPWTILKVDDQEQTISRFFTETVHPRISSDSNFQGNFELMSAQVGKDKNTLDLVDVTLPLVTVVNSFGPFLKYTVNIDSVTGTLSTTLQINNTSNNEYTPPIFIEPIRERTKKDKLFNDLIQFFNSSSVSLNTSELPMGKRLVTVMRDIFWHTDGHQHVFQQRAQPIPSVFESFTDYNNPELSKHRKRLTKNMSSDSLREFALELSTLLHCSFWDRPHWVELKPTFLSLLHSISSYVEYLVAKNKRVKNNHKSLTPVRDLSVNLHLKFITASEEDTILSLYVFEEKVVSHDIYQPVFITDLLPNDNVQKHRVLNSLISTGLKCPCILLVYSPGSNVSNLHFFWKVPDHIEVTECFEHSQPAIEQAKQLIPTYHTRAMRNAMYRKFGLVSSSVKPAV